MNGIINVLKPANMTSFDVVAYLRKLTNVKKIGHTGTLDPMATGVLPVCIGKSTGIIDYILNSNKEYVAEITFGANTTTQDNMGDVIDTFNIDSLTKENVEDAIYSFKGSYMQVPPMYSAIKINGQKLCDIARKGKIVEREPRKVFIHDIDIFSIKHNKAIFRCLVSKGTYIRTLCCDIGAKLGVGAYMSFLVRTKVGDFDINKALTLEEIKELNDNGKLSDIMLKPDCVLKHYPKVILTQNQERIFLNGGFIKQMIDNRSSEYFRVYSQNGSFLAIGSMIDKQGEVFLKSKKMFV